jgi:hypothetical protein
MAEDTSVPQDVNPAEGTATEPSTAKETTQPTVEDKGNAKSETTVETSNKVPEENRWAEKARKAEKEAQQLRAEIDQIKKAQPQPEVDPNTELVKQQLKQLGFITKDEQEAELRRRDDDTRVANELARLEQTFDGKDGRPKFDRQEIIEFALERQIGDLEAAYNTKYQPELINWHVEQAIAKSRGVKTETSDGSGSQEAGTTDSDLKVAIAKGDKTALRTYLKRFAPKPE